MLSISSWIINPVKTFIKQKTDDCVNYSKEKVQILKQKIFKKNVNEINDQLLRHFSLQWLIQNVSVSSPNMKTCTQASSMPSLDIDDNAQYTNSFSNLPQMLDQQLKQSQQQQQQQLLNQKKNKKKQKNNYAKKQSSNPVENGKDQEFQQLQQSEQQQKQYDDDNDNEDDDDNNVSSPTVQASSNGNFIDIEYQQNMQEQQQQSLQNFDVQPQLQSQNQTQNLLSFEEFSKALQRFSKYYNEHTFQEQIQDFYQSAITVWSRFKGKQPANSNQIKLAILEIVAKTLDKNIAKTNSNNSNNNFNNKNNDSTGLNSNCNNNNQGSENNFGDCLFKIFKNFIDKNIYPTEALALQKIKRNFNDLEYIKASKQYYQFFKKFINKQFPSNKKNKEKLIKKVSKALQHQYLRLFNNLLFRFDEIMDIVLNEKTIKALQQNNLLSEQLMKEDISQTHLARVQVQIIGLKIFLVFQQFQKVYSGSTINKVGQELHKRSLNVIIQESKNCVVQYSFMAIAKAKNYVVIKIKNGQQFLTKKILFDKISSNNKIDKLKLFSYVKEQIEIMNKNMLAKASNVSQIYQKCLNKFKKDQDLHNQKNLPLTAENNN